MSNSDCSSLSGDDRSHRPTCTNEADAPVKQLKPAMLGRNASCRRCSKPASFLCREEVVCAECFQYSFAKRVLKYLGGASNLKAGSRVFLAFSGGFSSAVLLFMLLRSKNSAKRKLFFDLKVVFVDDVSPVKLAPSEHVRTEIETTIASIGIQESDGFSYQIIPADKGFESREAFLSAFESARTASAKEELLVALRNRILLDEAAKWSASIMLFADSAKALVVKSLSDVCRGSGLTMPLHIMEKDVVSLPGCTIMRPMRDSLPREIAFYARSNSICAAVLPTFSSCLDPTATIFRATDHFVTNLQEGFPTTIHTVLRAAEKLSFVKLSEAGAKQAVFCVLCRDFMDGKELQLGHDTCYACRRMEQELPGLASQEPEFVQTARHRSRLMTRENMKAYLDDFLIEDADSFPAAYGAVDW
eukprot:ANDGO_01202.mRNA.1 Cytoplasmic tRNA 2-thiolation protein 2